MWCPASHLLILLILLPLDRLLGEGRAPPRLTSPPSARRLGREGDAAREGVTCNSEHSPSSWWGSWVNGMAGGWTCGEDGLDLTLGGVVNVVVVVVVRWFWREASLWAAVVEVVLGLVDEIGRAIHCWREGGESADRGGMGWDRLRTRRRRG